MAELPTGTVTLLFTDIEGSTRLLRRGRRVRRPARRAPRVCSKPSARTGASWSTARATPSSWRSGRRRTRLSPPATPSARSPSTTGPTGEEIRVRMGLHTGEPRVGRGPLRRARRPSRRARDGGRARRPGAPLGVDARAARDRRPRARPRRAPAEGPPAAAAALPARAGRPAERVPAAATLDNRPTNLPVPPNAFIDRERELAETRALLEQEGCGC